jgi:hypothetical protein
MASIIQLCQLLILGIVAALWSVLGLNAEAGTVVASLGVGRAGIYAALVEQGKLACSQVQFPGNIRGRFLVSRDELNKQAQGHS